jgi:hypothetical protein
MKKRPLLKMLLILLIIAVATPAIGAGCALGKKASKQELIVTIDGVEVDLSDMEMAKILEQTPSAEVIAASNFLYTPAYSTYTEVGKEIAKMHGELAQAIIT